MAKKRTTFSVPITPRQRVGIGPLAQPMPGFTVMDYELRASAGHDDFTAAEMAWALGTLQWESEAPSSSAVFLETRDDALVARANILRRWPGADVRIWARPEFDVPGGPGEPPDGEGECVPDEDGILVPRKAWFAKNGILVAL
jgi:hypothetical protein